MKKCGDQKRAITPTKARAALSLLAALAAASLPNTAFAQQTGETTVELQSGLLIIKNSDLSFGNFAPGTTRSNFRLNPNTGALIQQNGNAVSLGGTQSLASFTARGIPLLRIRLTIAENQINLVRDGGTETMRVNRFRLDGGRNRRFDASGQMTYNIGAQLRINANQAQGVYRGTFNITIDYR